MAEIEKEYGVISTYMVMLNSPTYEINSKESQVILKQLISMGHEIGLHFDLRQDMKNQDVSVSSIESDIKQDIKHLEQIIDFPVQSLSFHRPLSQFLRGPIKIADMVNAYSKELMSWYLSDSAGKWREGEPVAKLHNSSADLLQLLIHPIWWGDVHADATDRLEVYFTNKTKEWAPNLVSKFDKALSRHIGVRRSGFREDVELGNVFETGKFDTDANALAKWIEAHEKYGSNNLNEWIFRHLTIVKGSHILDLGCGTGKQTIPAAEIIGDEGSILAFDTSKEALDRLWEKVRQSKVGDRITTQCGNFEELENYLNSKKFDRVLGSYSLYYAKNHYSLFMTLHKNMIEGGIFFFCGPSKENNAELKKFQCSLLNNKSLSESTSARFMEQTGFTLAKEIFTKIECYTFENSLVFDSAESLYRYWTSYNLFHITSMMRL